MKNIISFLLILFSLISLQGCSLIGDIFEFGLWTGIIIVVLVVVILGYLISRIRRR